MDILSLVIKVASNQVTQAQAQVNSLTGALNSSQNAAYKFGDVIGTAAKAAALSVGSLALGITALSAALANQVDDLQDAAEMYGYSATQIAAMKTAAADAGGTLEDVMKASSRARKELALGGEAYKNLGISVRDANGQLKGGVELASEVAQKYRDGATTAAQFDDVQKILGKDVDQAAAVLGAQADAMQLVNELQERGIGIVQGATDATNEYMKAKNRATLVMQSAGSILVANVVPAFTALISKLTDSYVNGGLVRQAFDSLIATIPGVIEFGGTVAKVFGTAFNVVLAFGKTLGAVGAALVALFSGDFGGAKQVFLSWKQDIDDIDASNERFKTGVDNTVKSMVSATKAAKDLTIAKQGNGKSSQGDTPLPKSTDRPDESLTRAIQQQQTELIRLEGAYKAINGEYVETARLVAMNDIANGKYAKQLAQVSKEKSEELKQTLLSNASKIDEQKRINDLAAAQKKANDAIDAARDSSRREIEENRIRIQVLSRVGATHDELNVAIAGYRLQMAEKKLADAIDNKATEEKLIKLREEVALLREKAGVAGSVKKDNDAETERQQTFGSGWKNAFDRYTKDATNAAKVAEAAFSSLATNSESAIEKFVMTGKFSFGDFARSVLADLAKIAAKQLVVWSFKQLIGGGFADGGAFSGGVQLFADGGVVDRPTAFGMAGGRLGVMGEAGPEAIMPLKRGPDGKLGVAAASAAGDQISNTYNLTVSIGSVDSDARKDQLLREIDQLIEAKTKKTMANELRQGGMLNRHRQTA